MVRAEKVSLKKMKIMSIIVFVSFLTGLVKFRFKFKSWPNA